MPPTIEKGEAKMFNNVLVDIAVTVALADRLTALAKLIDGTSKTDLSIMSLYADTLIAYNALTTVGTYDGRIGGGR